MRKKEDCTACGSAMCLRCRTIKMIRLLALDLERTYPVRANKQITELRRIAMELERV